MCGGQACQIEPTANTLWKIVLEFTVLRMLGYLYRLLVHLHLKGLHVCNSRLEEHEINTIPLNLYSTSQFRTFSSEENVAQFKM